MFFKHGEEFLSVRKQVNRKIPVPFRKCTNQVIAKINPRFLFVLHYGSLYHRISLLVSLIWLNYNMHPILFLPAKIISRHIFTSHAVFFSLSFSVIY